MAKSSIQKAALIAIVLGPSATVLAQSPLIQPEFQSAAAVPLETASGVDRACVLLRNDNVLFGQAHQVGQFVVVRGGQNAELQLPRQQVACWAPSLRDLYRYRVDHRHRSDLSTHLQDARWCVRYDLFAEAAIELDAARAIDPTNLQVASIQAHIDRAHSPNPRSAPVIQYDTQSSEQVEQVDHQAVAAAMSGVDLAMLQFFAANVQPTLMNRCGSCHDHTSGRPWSMMVPGLGARASARMTRENLAASLAFIDNQTPANSVLLQKAVSPHGGSDAPLDLRHAKSIEALTLWLTVVGKSQNESVEIKAAFEVADAGSGPDLGPLLTPAAQSSGAQSNPAAYVAERPIQTAAEIARPELSPSAESVEHPTAPSRMPVVSDPFSPDLFNRRHHGQ
ncbi:hypothetical protein [Rubripirellula reticaptiva]|uniref:Cytochrome c domain-containing protein n=1 Tax=Rubripirellula reticaptiva TaxID=2528013 RepID=A0A5C6F2J5_9BACT|nr:hypothetical protein [Rubripirellula reticaptiva]TWU55345.1 hypothetical protein Poly59_16430 [Rubripirellula reticaptiva]